MENNTVFKACWSVNGIFKADANSVAKELNSLDSITPQNVVDYARNEDTELHKCFEWNDEKAAEKYRLSQAGQIIRMIRIETEKKETQVRMFSLTTEKSVYAPTIKIFQKVDEYENLLKQAIMELQAFQRKYKNLTELEKIFEEIEFLN